MIRRFSLVFLARVLNAGYFVATAVYCLLAFNPFTYQQFVKPHVSDLLTAFAVWHVDLFWLTLSVTALTLAPHLEQRRARGLGWSYLAVSALFGVWLLRHPVWQYTALSSQAAVVALVSMAWPAWLGLFDHVCGSRPPLTSSDDRVTTRACLAAALFAWVIFAAAVPLRLRWAGGLDLTPGGAALGSGVSLVAHLVVCALALLVLLGGAGLATWARTPGRAEYAMLWAMTAAGLGGVFDRMVLQPIAITGSLAWSASALLGLMAATSWSGIVYRRLAARTSAYTALEAFLAPVEPRSPALGGVLLAAAAIGGHALVALAGTFDWEFMVQKLTAIGVWAIAFAMFYFRAARNPGGSPRVWRAPLLVLLLFWALQSALPRLSGWTRDVRLHPEFALDAYAAVDPSYRVVRGVLGAGDRSGSAGFYAFLKRHSTIEDAGLQPVSVEFASRLESHGRRTPHVFLFIIDSLRRDYLSPYNPAVTFTPAIQAFAEESFTFRRAFSRYGGTGLSVPSIWAGSMLIHKQYVTPFAPTNALEKLVDAHGYRRFISEDHIADELFSASPLTVGLDHAIPEMLHTFCGTMGQLTQELAAHQHDSRPLFALTRPLDLHIGNIKSAVLPAGESYPGFYGPYAARVGRIDRCFGRFVETLKTLGLYDDSIIVLTADHGDSLGEGQRWGHGFTIYPEVVRIPLFIHVPPALRPSFATDLGRVSFSTDITPTLYALLGHVPGARDALIGSPLLVPPGDDATVRRREPYMVASSYGAVYGVIANNGRSLYIADGIEGRDYAFDLGVSGADRRVRLTDAQREHARQTIRDQIGALASRYHFTPAP